MLIKIEDIQFMKLEEATEKSTITKKLRVL